MSQFSDGPDSLEHMLHDLKRMVPRWLQGKELQAVIGIIIAIWLLSGSFYIVGPDEQGVVRRFGKMVRVTAPGLRFRLPFPVEAVDTPKVTEVRRIETGFRTIDPGQR